MRFFDGLRHADADSGNYCRFGLDTIRDIHTIPPGPTLGGDGCVDSCESVMEGLFVCVA